LRQNGQTKRAISVSRERVKKIKTTKRGKKREDAHKKKNRTGFIRKFREKGTLLKKEGHYDVRNKSTGERKKKNVQCMEDGLISTGKEKFWYTPRQIVDQGIDSHEGKILDETKINKKIPYIRH